MFMSAGGSRTRLFEPERSSKVFEITSAAMMVAWGNTG